ncbi:MAG: cytochrome c-type biogenesis protein CcmE [SAR86 cluster bacterium SAR86A]|jgi:cytochrome c-type biogenesis protein CcmE|uniref:Cytochrome c-type biogenesis protein CcmE n=1 Tax=SAR86 cluster bacterium SAR86A TaxID=1123866 RepID=J4WUD1_9GAMM|nr:MAG: cytochrome c-type biogenesis protein CcmE [SAR86 cluster bacterium SAR86A]MAN84785.1 cytochrome c maturation protein CcmE [Gammaproteobacteria bacterium]MEC7773692.1 cytochrome c maturation protein CcmE [Pseudomonadota bacterium]|tara:strand:- start:125 stop:535 length:411 start_codon:yes stop_codon:yes gene_type:complete
MNQIRKKRLYNILLVSLFSVSGISLILYSLNSNLDYFFTPTELKEQNISSDKRIKIGGMVLEGSVFRNDSNISFTVTDYESFVKVEFKGIVPDLFQEGSGVVALGYLNDEVFYAEEVLAKHDENYMPPNIEINNDS